MRHIGAYANHLRYVEEVIGLAGGGPQLRRNEPAPTARDSTVYMRSPSSLDPRQKIARMAILAAAELRRFGQAPRALVSLQLRDRQRSVGTQDAGRARTINRRAPDLEVEGEMHTDAALSRPLLNRIFPDARLSAEANLLIMPNLDAANATFNALKIVAGRDQRRADPARRRQACPHPHPHGNSEGDREYDRADGRGRWIGADAADRISMGTRHGNGNPDNGGSGIPSPRPVVSAPLRPSTHAIVLVSSWATSIPPSAKR